MCMSVYLSFSGAIKFAAKTAMQVGENSPRPIVAPLAPLNSEIHSSPIAVLDCGSSIPNGRQLFVQS